MLDRTLIFGGDIIPAAIATAPHIIRPVRKITTTPIAGSNREVIVMEDAWESYDQPYSLFFGDGTEDCVQEIVNEIAEKLYKKGWQELQDSYEPEYFRLAYYQGPFDVENRFTRAGKVDITFKCRPERFLLSGSFPVEVEQEDVLINPTKFNAKPLIHIEGQGNGTLTIGNAEMTFTGIVDYLNIDCDRLDVYRLPSENRNSVMEGDFPVLISGNNTVDFDGGITKVVITPRYWTI